MVEATTPYLLFGSLHSPAGGAAVTGGAVVAGGAAVDEAGDVGSLVLGVVDSAESPMHL